MSTSKQLHCHRCYIGQQLNKMIYITINTVAEFFCFVIAFLFLCRDKDPAWLVFIPYLLLTCIVEIAGITMHHSHKTNIPLYTVFVLAECFIISFFFYRLYRPYGAKISMLMLWFAIFLGMYLTELYLNHFNDFVSVTASVMSVIFVITGLYYYYLKLNDDNFERLLFYPSFWWVNGTLFFYFGGTVCNLFFEFLIKYPSASYSYSVRYLIYGISNVILYSCWSYAFICRHLQMK